MASLWVNYGLSLCVHAMCAWQPSDRESTLEFFLEWILCLEVNTELQYSECSDIVCFSCIFVQLALSDLWSDNLPEAVLEKGNCQDFPGGACPRPSYRKHGVLCMPSLIICGQTVFILVPTNLTILKHYFVCRLFIVSLLGSVYCMPRHTYIQEQARELLSL